jgi:hypothetical protein
VVGAVSYILNDMHDIVTSEVFWARNTYEHHEVLLAWYRPAQDGDLEEVPAAGEALTPLGLCEAIPEPLDFVARSP